MKKKLFALSALVLATAFMAIACSAPAPIPSASPSVEAAQSSESAQPSGAAVSAEASAASPAAQLTVSAAASLTDVMKEIAEAYKEQAPDVSVTFNFGASGTLQQQIEQGAPADVFVSAAAKQMDALESKGMILKDSRVDLLENKLVLVIPADKDEPADFESLADAGQLAIGDPASVPAGQYAEQALTQMGIYDELNSGNKIVLGSDVRAVLNWVETGNADAGIVYATDALTSDKVKIAATAPSGSHDPVIYPAAVLDGSANAEAAQAFLDFLSTPDISALFEKYGFTALKK